MALFGEEVKLIITINNNQEGQAKPGCSQPTTTTDKYRTPNPTTARRHYHHLPLLQTTFWDLENLVQEEAKDLKFFKEKGWRVPSVRRNVFDSSEKKSCWTRKLKQYGHAAA